MMAIFMFELCTTNILEKKIAADAQVNLRICGKKHTAFN